MRGRALESRGRPSRVALMRVTHAPSRARTTHRGCISMLFCERDARRLFAHNLCLQYFARRKVKCHIERVANTRVYLRLFLKILSAQWIHCSLKSSCVCHFRLSCFKTKECENLKTREKFDSCCSLLVLLKLQFCITVAFYCDLLCGKVIQFSVHLLHIYYRNLILQGIHIMYKYNF